MKKRGQGEVLSLLLIGEVIFVIVVFAALMFYANNTYKEGHSYREAYLQKEVTNMLHMVRSANGDMTVTYPIGKYDYTISFDKGVDVQVSEETLVTTVNNAKGDLIIEKKNGIINVLLNGEVVYAENTKS